MTVMVANPSFELKKIGFVTGNWSFEVFNSNQSFANIKGVRFFHEVSRLSICVCIWTKTVGKTCTVYYIITGLHFGFTG